MSAETLDHFGFKLVLWAATLLNVSVRAMEEACEAMRAGACARATLPITSATRSTARAGLAKTNPAATGSTGSVLRSDRRDDGVSSGKEMESLVPCQPMVTCRPLISPEAAAGYDQRWAATRRRLAEELQATPMETKLRRVASLMALAGEMGWIGTRDAEEEAVRKRWMTLRRAMLGKA